MKKLMMKTTILAICSWTLVATGLTGGFGGGGGTGGGANGSGVIGGSATSGNNQAHEILNSTAKKTSFLVGIAELSNNADNGIKLARVTGNLAHENGALSVNNGDYNFVDENGKNGNKLYSDGSSTLTFNSKFKGDYKYATTYQQTFKTGGQIVNVNGVIGIATNKDKLQNAKKSVFNGEAEMVYITSQVGMDIKSEAKITADFGTGKVDVGFGKMVATDLVTGQEINVPFGGLKITDMTVTGNEFSGGEITAYTGEFTHELVGKNQVGVAHGAFYGWFERDKTPDEAGGQFLLQGDNGSIGGTFLSKRY